jgi:hypothetical protein
MRTELVYSTDDGKTWQEAPTGIRVAVNGLCTTDDMPASLAFNFTEEGVIRDLTNEESGDCIGTDSVLYYDLVADLEPYGIP